MQIWRMTGQLTHLTVLFLILSAGFLAMAQETGDSIPWIPVAATTSVPAFQYRAWAEEHTLRVLVRLPPAMLEKKEEPHFWIADPRMVKAKAAMIAQLKRDIKEYREQLAGKETDECHKQAIRTAAKATREQLLRFDQYDPYLQWTIGGAPSAESSQKPGHREFESRQSLDQGFDLKTANLTEVLFGIALTTPDAPIPPSPTHLSRIQFPKAIVAGVSRELQLQLSLVPESVFLYRSGGYFLAKPGVASVPGCYAADSFYPIPAFWKKLELKNFSTSPTMRLYGYDSQLLLADSAHAGVLSIKDHLSSGTDQEYELIHLSAGAGRVYLLLTVSGTSKDPSSVSGSCGAGSETDLVWVQIESAGTAIKKIVAENIESACHSASGEDRAQGSWTQKDRWEIIFNDDKTEKRWTYDSLHPERGPQISSKPMKPE